MATPEFLAAQPESIAPYVPFGTPHIVAIITVFAVAISATLFFRMERFAHLRRPFQLVLFALMLTFEITYRLWYVIFEPTQVVSHLGLHLCGIAIMLTLYTLWTRNYRFFYLIYFWALAAAPQAIFTPALGHFGYPHYQFVHVFISHGLLITAVLHFIFAENQRPEPGSFVKAILVTNGLLIVIALLNYALSTNYFYICQKPENTILDHFGPWPWYILGIELLGIILFSLVYLPILIERKIKAR